MKKIETKKARWMKWRLCRRKRGKEKIIQPYGT